MAKRRFKPDSPQDLARDRLTALQIVAHATPQDWQALKEGKLPQGWDPRLGAHLGAMGMAAASRLAGDRNTRGDGSVTMGVDPERLARQKAAYQGRGSVVDDLFKEMNRQRGNGAPLMDHSGHEIIDGEVVPPKTELPSPTDIPWTLDTTLASGFRLSATNGVVRVLETTVVLDGSTRTPEAPATTSPAVSRSPAEEITAIIPLRELDDTTTIIPPSAFRATRRHTNTTNGSERHTAPDSTAVLHDVLGSLATQPIAYSTHADTAATQPIPAPFHNGDERTQILSGNHGIRGSALYGASANGATTAISYSTYGPPPSTRLTARHETWPVVSLADAHPTTPANPGFAPDNTEVIPPPSAYLDANGSHAQ